MTVSRRGVLSAMAAAALAAALPRAFAERRLNVAMHASASERLALLAERIGKAHVQLAQGVQAVAARRALRDSAGEFDALLPHAASLAPDAEARDNFLLLGLLWKQLREWSRKAPTRENARHVCDRVEEVAWVAEKGAQLLRPEGTAQREALGAMHAATLAQRVARLELLKRIAPYEASRDAQALDAAARLGSLLASLIASPHVVDLEDDLGMASTQHQFLLEALRQYAVDGAPAAADLIAKTADYIADSMERASRLYENGAG